MSGQRRKCRQLAGFIPSSGFPSQRPLRTPLSVWSSARQVPSWRRTSTCCSLDVCQETEIRADATVCSLFSSFKRPFILQVIQHHLASTIHTLI